MDPREALIDSLANNVRILEAFTSSIPEAALHERRRPDAWTVGEHLGHLAEVQPMLCDRIEAFGREERPAFTPYFPPEGESPSSGTAVVDPAAALAAFGRWRGRQVGLLSTMKASDWRKEAVHPEYRRYSLTILARHILMHDHWHMYRMEELWLTRDEFLMP
jgi:hypothetical protein